MRRLLVLTATLALACSLPQGSGVRAPIPISVTSHNRSGMDVYLLCGNHSAELVGLVGPRETALFELPASRAHCVQGLNFFLVSRTVNRGYWVGPFWPRSGLAVHLTIEKYVPLSTALVRFN